MMCKCTKENLNNIAMYRSSLEDDGSSYCCWSGYYNRPGKGAAIGFTIVGTLLMCSVVTYLFAVLCNVKDGLRLLGAVNTESPGVANVELSNFIIDTSNYTSTSDWSGFWIQGTILLALIFLGGLALVLTAASIMRQHLEVADFDDDAIIKTLQKSIKNQNLSKPNESCGEKLQSEEAAEVPASDKACIASDKVCLRMEGKPASNFGCSITSETI